MRTRNHDWYDPHKQRPLYGIQVRHMGCWANLAIDGRPVLYVSESERDRVRAEISKRPITPEAME